MLDQKRMNFLRQVSSTPIFFRMIMKGKQKEKLTWKQRIKISKRLVGFELITKNYREPERKSRVFNY